MTTSINKRLQQVKTLSRDDWQVLLVSLLLLPLMAIVLKAKGYKWTQAFLHKKTLHSKLSSSPIKDQLNEAKRVAYITEIAASHGVYHAKCLEKSLAVWWLLRRRGIDSELKIGVNKDAGYVSAHAWVEYRENVLTDASDVGDRFSAFSDNHFRAAKSG